MIRVVGLDHVVFRTTQLKAMLHFYRDILGCPVERELAPETGLTQLRAGNALIDLVTVDSELGRMGGGAPRQDGRNVDHVCLQIAPVQEEILRSYLEQQGVECSDFARRYGAQGFGRSIYLEDPEGNVVELKPRMPE